jgi:class 3 adenylate cyclase/tetratricopeptide (TPR) repeat protein
MAELASLLPVGQAWERPDERRLITALFADVSGFTTLADRLDPEQLIERMDPILERMGQIVDRYEGHVSKYAGDAILAFFGAPLAHEDDAVRAVLAARDMHKEIAEVVATLPDDVQHLTLHIGVNTGHVVTGFRGGQVRLDYSVLGDAVNVAQRLEASSSSGEIYVGESTYTLARKAVRFESVGELVLKGKPDPIRAWRVTDDDETMPVVAPAGGDEVIYGRDMEIAIVATALDTIASGQPVVVALVGEPGVGKSRLLQETRRLAAGSGVTWLDTRCLSYGSALAYRPYLDLIRRMVGARQGDAEDEVRRRVTSFAASLGMADDAPYLVHVVGVSSQEIPQNIRDNAQALGRRVRDAITSLVLTRAGSGPVALAVEDVHWMDAASLEVTAQLVSRSAGLPLCFAFTSRPEGAPSIERLVGGSVAKHVLELTGVDHDAAQAIAQTILGATLDPTALAELVARTRGNALFIQEVVRSLLDAEALTPDPTGWTIRAGHFPEVPSTIESVLAARIDLLPRDAADILQVASVIGRDMRITMLRDLAALSEEALDQVVGILVERQFLDRVVEAGDPRLVFHHALVADVAYGRLLRKRRRELHRRLVEVVLRRYGSGDDVIDLLARHAYLGGMAADAVPYIERAAERATALFANVEAMGYLAQAIDIVDADAGPHDQLSGLLMKRGELLDRTGRFVEAAEDFHRVYGMTRDATAALAEASALYRVDRSIECTELLDRVERDHPHLSTAQRANVLVTRARIMVFSGNTNSAIDVLSDGLTALLAEGGAGSPAEADIRQFRGRVRSIVSAFDAAIEDLDIAISILKAAGDLPRLATALRTLGGLLTDAGHQDAGVATLQRALEVARQVGHAEEIGAASLNLGWAYCEASRLDEALACTEEAMAAFASMGLISGVANAKVNQCDILLDLDRAAEAKAVAVEALALARETGHQRWTAGALAVLADVALREGDFAASADHSTQSVQIFEELADEMHAAIGRERLEKVHAAQAADST